MSKAVYCAGCNARFPAREDRAHCPRCGAMLGEDDFDISLAETMLLRDSVDGTETVPPTRVDFGLVGRRLDVYHCEELLGQGSMGHVYRSRHVELDRQCALKILSPELAERDSDYVRRFQSEGRAAAALVHPNIVTVHACGEEEGFHFLEMEYVEGRSLQSKIDREGPVTPLRATVLAAQIAEGLAAAHRFGIAHRDLKPDNVLLTPRGIPKIADFGLAKRVTGSDSAGSGRFLVGTPHYMAPELLAGEAASPSSDVYALGVVYYALLTGEVPFPAGSFGELRRRVSSEPLPSVRDQESEIPLEMAECLSLLLSKTPATRPRDGIEAAQLLEAVGGQMRDVESLLNESFSDDASVVWTRDGTRYLLQVTLPDGRRQALIVEPSEHSAAERLLLIYSVCCEARPDYYEDALRLNSRLSHGGLAIRNVDGRDCFVMIDTYPRATVDPAEVRCSVLEVAYRADDVERLLTGDDRH